MYPALAVVQTWLARKGLEPGEAVLWIGSRRGMEAELVQRAGVPFQAIHSAGVHGVGWRMPGNALQLIWGCLQAWGLMRSFKAEVLLVTGGYLAVPAALAAWCRRIPILLYVPDIEPALAARLVSRLASRIAVTAEAARGYFPPPLAGRVTVSGYPLRPELTQCSRAQGQAHFDLDPRRPTLLVTGGSRGARSLNRAAFAALPEWLTYCQVIHICGEWDREEAERQQSTLPAHLRRHYHLFPFIHEMGLALAVADLVVSRAGASVLGEYPLFGLPAILVPYPYAWHYQEVNAHYLVAQGAAVCLPDDESLPSRVRQEVRELLSDAGRRERMRTAACALARPDAADHLIRHLEVLAAVGRRQRR